MKDETTAQVACADCGKELPAEEVRQTTSPPCPHCGSVKRNVTLSFVDSVAPMHDSLEGKLKNTKLPSKKNPRVHFFTGDDIRHSDGKWMNKTRMIDKDKDEYSEIVTDPETGEIVHQCNEPLSQHTAHGAAKRKPKK